jgi:salicylate hydroxylase
VQLHRADLHDALASRVRELSPSAIVLNKRVVSFSEDADGVQVQFSDGTSAHGSLLIGADGLKSAVRRQMIGDVSATYTGDVAWRIVVPTSQLPADLLERAMSVFMGPGGHVVCYYLRAGDLLNFVGMVETDDVSEESWTVKLPWRTLKSHYAGWHPTIQTVIDAADRDQCYQWSLYARAPIDNWSTGRTTLIGDAAHPTLPYLAQGAAMAIEDGAVLVRALDMCNSVPEALQFYQRNRLSRTARIVKQSMENRSTFHLRSVEAIKAHFAKRNEGEDRNNWLYSYNPLTVPLV